uniref:C1q domain-containing protein n=1 Tax=Magallana gigas TaxID=29159 RepID=A0A8W8M7G3_MAGGI
MINDEVLGNGTVIVFDQVNTNLGQGQWGGWMRDKSGNLVTNSAMFHIKSRDQVYICSRYTTPYFGAMSQFSGWLQLPGPAFNIWAAGKTLNATVMFDDIITNNDVTINEAFCTVSLLQRGLYFLSWTVHAYNDSVILSSLAVDDVIILTSL